MMSSNLIKLPKYGFIKPSTTKQVYDNVVSSYIKIPFAQPPIGNLRFKPPQKCKPWNGFMGNSSIESSSLAMQSISYFNFAHSTYFPLKQIFNQKNITEDCLYLNVFAPQKQEDELLPVMVYFHGGAFRLGPITFYDASILAGLNDVIVVVPSYRLNIFGFLSMGIDSDCKGNLGLLDQVQSLRWVNENISYFGGDKNNVTIFGQSAGAISVHWHLMSTLSKGLFHKAISCSGAGTSIKTFVKDQSRPYQKLLEILNLEKLDKKEVFMKLQSMSSEELLRADETLLMMGFAWMAVLDNHFFTDTPQELLSRGEVSKIPYLIGFNSDEGGWSMQDMFPQFRKGLKKEEFKRFSGSMLRWLDKSIDIRRATEFLSKFELNAKVRDELRFSRLQADVTGDTIFLIHVIRAAERHSELGNPTFLYYFKHPPLYNHDNRFGPTEAFKGSFVGADHSDENLLLFGFPFMDEYIKEDFYFSDEEKTLSRKIMKYFTNFAKQGNPNLNDELEWPLYTKEERRHLCFDIPCSIGSNIGLEEVHLYTKVLPKL